MVSAIPARAWDQHHLLTRYALEGFESRDPDLWGFLNSPVEVRPIESFIQSAFGTGCTLSAFQDRVLEGVGKNFAVQYAEGAVESMSLDWDKGDNYVSYRFLPGADSQNSQAVGSWVSPASVLTIYSDEPDWLMDDDVPRLKNVGIAKGISGSGTRILRHFWFEGEDIFGVDMSVGQELDRRVQLFYELSLVAFSVNEPYWGFRFLADAIHYIQDLTQPFHVKALVNSGMVYETGFFHAFRCSLFHDADCVPNALARAKILTGWLVGTYHSIYEDFARGLLAGGIYGSPRRVSDIDRDYEAEDNIEALTFPRQGSRLVSFRPVVEQIQRIVLTRADTIGREVYDFFGHQFRYDAQLQRRELLAAGSQSAVGYQNAVASQYDILLTPGQSDLKSHLIEDTHALFERAGAWTRSFLEETLPARALVPPGTLSGLRAEFKSRCEDRAHRIY